MTLAILILVLFTNSGCSVAMALKGTRKKDTASLSIGTARTTVLKTLGDPAETKETPAGLIDIFNYTVDDKSSPGRAFGHLFMDVFSFFLWELHSTEYESTRGTYETIKVEYDQDNNVVRMYQEK